MVVDASEAYADRRANYWGTKQVVFVWMRRVDLVSKFQLKCFRVHLQSMYSIHSSELLILLMWFSRDDTPLDTLEIIKTSIGELIASPFLNDENKQSGNKCIWTGMEDGDLVWTDSCSTDNPWQAWELRPVNGYQNRLQLVHRPTGRCAKIISNSSNSKVYTTSCYADSSMIWSWVDEASSVPNIFDWIHQELPIPQLTWNNAFGSFFPWFVHE